MGTILLGILGGVKGKVGPVIGASWKGIDYVKGYAVPSNPNTTAQQEQRSLFKFVLDIAQMVLTSVIQPYWINREPGMSEYNSFMRKNLKEVSAVDNYSEVVMADGDLEGAAITTSAYDATFGTVDVTWSKNTLGNGELTDKAIVVVVDAANKISFVNSSSTRNAESVNMSVGTGRNFSDLHAYLFFARGSGVDLLVSNSSYSSVAEA